jgi:hypothetical protein
MSSCQTISVIRHNKHVDPKKNDKKQDYCIAHGKWKCDGKPRKELLEYKREESKKETKPKKPFKKWDDDDE